MHTKRAEEMRGPGISGFGAEGAGHLLSSAEYLGLVVPDVANARIDKA